MLKGRSARDFVMPILFLVGALLLPQVASGPTGWLPIVVLVFCANYVLFALGLNVVVGYAGLLDLGYVAFFLLGAYVAAWLMSTFFFQVDPGLHFLSAVSGKLPGIHLSFWLVMIVAAIVAAIAGVIIGAPTLRLSSDYLALVTLGFGEILPELFRNGEFKRFNLSNGTKGIGPLDPIGNGILSDITGGLIPKTVSVFDHKTRYYIILFFCILFIYISMRLRDGRLGRAWLAIREDELAASLMGVPLMRAKLWSYAIGAAAGGFGGTFYAATIGTVNVDGFTFLFSIIILCCVIVGGMANVWGVILGAFILTWFNYAGLQKIGETVNSTFGTDIDVPGYTFAFYGVVLVLMMLFRRDGLLPAARQKQVRQLEEKLETVGTAEAAP